MYMGDGLHAEAAAEQYRPSSRYSINVIIARHESSNEAEAYASCLKEWVQHCLTPFQSSNCKGNLILDSPYEFVQFEQSYQKVSNHGQFQ